MAQDDNNFWIKKKRSDSKPFQSMWVKRNPKITSHAVREMGNQWNPVKLGNRRIEPDPFL